MCADGTDCTTDDVLDEDEDDDEDEVQATADQSTYRTKSGRVTHSVDQYKPSMKGQSYNQCHLHTQSNDQTEYDMEHARLIANVMTDMNERAKCGNLTEHSFVESFDQLEYHQIMQLLHFSKCCFIALLAKLLESFLEQKAFHK